MTNGVLRDAPPDDVLVQIEGEGSDTTAEDIKRRAPPWPMSRMELYVLQRMQRAEAATDLDSELNEGWAMLPAHRTHTERALGCAHLYPQHRLPRCLPSEHPASEEQQVRSRGSLAPCSCWCAPRPGRPHVEQTAPVAAVPLLGQNAGTGNEPDGSAGTAEALTLLDLPDELLEHIAAQLPVRSVAALSLVNRRLHTATRSSDLWLTLYNRDFGWPPLASPHYNCADARRPRDRWRAAAANAVRARYEQAFVQCAPRTGYIDTWRRADMLVTLQRRLEQLNAEQRRRHVMELAYSFVQGPVMVWLAFLMLLTFVAMLPLKIARVGAIADWPWTLVFWPIWVIVGLLVAFFGMSVGAVARRFKTRFLKFSPNPPVELSLLGAVAGALAGFAVAASIRLDFGGVPGIWLVVFAPLWLLCLAAGGIAAALLPSVRHPYGRLLVVGWMLLAAACLAQLVLLPLRMEGIITAPWHQVLIPCWVLDVAVPVAAVAHIGVRRWKQLTGAAGPPPLPAIVSLSLVLWTTALFTAFEVLLTLYAAGELVVPAPVLFVPLYMLMVVYSQPVHALLIAEAARLYAAM